MANKTSFNSGRTLDAATENIEILTGARGNKLDKAITLRELGELGLANLVKVGNAYKASASSSSPDSNASSNVEWPSSPENVSASGAFNVILIQWDQPRYKGHQYAEIWRAEEDNLSKAVWIGATAAVIYPDPIGGDAKAYYWVRFVNSNGDKGTFNSQSGIYAETSVDVAQILEALTHQISADQLTTELLTPIQVAATQAAQWSVKTTVADLTGGFGLLNDGEKVRFTVSAQLFAIVDPTLENNAFVPFAVSDGKVIISNAFIDTAYIQTIVSEQITADKINALELNSVNITGGTLTLGSGDNVMMANGGALGIGKGGLNSGWGYSWHTIIYADGSIYTDRLYASSGSFTGTVYANAGVMDNITIKNATISEDCDVKGTIYANKIVGDVVALKPFNTSVILERINKGGTLELCRFLLSVSSKARYVKISGTIIDNQTSLFLQVLINSTILASKNGSVDGVYLVPASSSTTTVLIRAYYTGSYDHISISASFVGDAMVTSVYSGTFV